VALSPAVVYVAATLSEGLGASDAAGRGTVDSVSSIITIDFSTYASLLATTALLAPLLEETVFRGFLLTSLTKWMPVPAAVALSSLAFGMVHLTPRDFPQACWALPGVAPCVGSGMRCVRKGLCTATQVALQALSHPLAGGGSRRRSAAPLPPPQLTALGVLLGFTYVRSRNLLTPMLIHGAWNGSVLTILFFLASQGIDINELIHAN
jgi:membrane protease YdiL (CAAX protease family)